MTTLRELSEMVDDAAVNLAAVTSQTPLTRSERLSQATGCEVLLKREDQQPVRSYKVRGAYHLISGLTQAERDAGVVCASAGNHGQGVAWSCARLGIQGRIYIPSTTPRQKRNRMLELGQGRIELVVAGETYDEAADAALLDVAARHATLVPAFDDLRTAAGQGTVASEVIHQLGRDPDVFIMPVGGGGLAAGCSAWLRTHRPNIRLVGVEPAGAPSMSEALLVGAPVTLTSVDTFVDGAAVRRAGEVTFPLVRDAAIEMLAVPEGQVCTEMLDLYQTDGIIAEPAGALASAALPTAPINEAITLEPGQLVVAILSGGNNDVSRYAEIIERALVNEGRKHYFLVQFPQEPGSLRRFLDDVLGDDDDITYFEYVKRSNRDTGPALVGIELGDPYEYPQLLKRFEESPVQFEVIEPDSSMHRFLV